MRDIILLNDLKYEGIINMPIFKIEYIEASIDLSQYDALIFTSKNAICAIDSFNKEWKGIPSYCIAPKTASVVKSHNGQVEFIGKKSHGNEFAQELIPLLKNKKSLYIRASKTVSKLTEILKNNYIEIEELIAYQTKCNEDEFTKPRENSIIVFTSPSSVECFFKRFVWNNTYKAVVIGKTTAKYLPQNIEYEISQTQNIDTCIKLALSLTN